jgi:hypothetical protein
MIVATAATAAWAGTIDQGPREAGWLSAEELQVGVEEQLFEGLPEQTLIPAHPWRE